VDSQSTDRTREIAGAYPQVRVVPIAKFTHGEARNLGARESSGEIVVLLTQDALPKDDAWLAELLEPFADPTVAATYSRQVPREDANPMERFFLLTRFPAEAAVRRAGAPGEPLSLEQVFFSNVSSALRRELLLQHPFDTSLIMSEDQQVSRDLLQAGYAVAYQPASVVVHSHEYPLPTVFRRYFDSVYSLTLIFPSHSMGVSTSMGLSYLIREIRYILTNYPAHFPYYCLYTVMKTAGTVTGHFAERLPRRLVRKLSLHAYHWREDP